MPPTPLLCRCGHPQDLHDHYRPAQDCGFCGRAICPEYRPPGRWARWARHMTRVDRDLTPLLTELARLREAERTLRTVVALHPYNGRTA
jgi:hypothetical protein